MVQITFSHVQIVTRQTPNSLYGLHFYWVFLCAVVKGLGLYRMPTKGGRTPLLCEKVWELKFFRFSRFAPILAHPSAVIFIVVRFFFLGLGTTACAECS